MPYRLDEKTHKIFIDAPSVTTIVNEVYPFDASAINPKYLKMGQDKGTCVHKQIEMYIKYGSKIGCTCDKQVKTHVEQGKWLCDWWDKFKENIPKNEDYGFYTMNEVIGYGVIDPGAYELTGIADCICMQGKEAWVIDWKTTKDEHPKKEAMQTWMYDMLFTNDYIGNEKEFTTKHHIIVNSNNKDSYELTPEQMEQGKQDALKGLQLYKEKRGKDIWK